MKRFYKTFSIKSLNERTVEAIVSQEIVDLDKEVLLLSGADLSIYKKNPVFAMNHDLSQILGKAISIKIVGDKLIAKLKFDVRPDSQVGAFQPDVIYERYKSGSQKQFSVGYNILETRQATKLDKERFGKDTEIVITKWQLLEISAVPIGANQGSATLSVKTPDKAEVIEEEELITEEETEEETTEIDAEELKKEILAEVADIVKELIKELLDKPEEEAVEEEETEEVVVIEPTKSFKKIRTGQIFL